MLYQWIYNTFSFAPSKAIAIEGIIMAISVFVLSVVCMSIVIPILKKYKVGQHIHEDLEEHAAKAGTPTMGGIGFIIAFLLICLIWVILEVSGAIGYLIEGELVVFAYTILLGVLNALIGIVDDRAKLRRAQNEGLSEKQKLALQIVVAVAYVCVMAVSGNLPTAFAIPFTSYSLNLWYFAYPLYVLVIVGFVNSTNITDGLDGLASTVGVSVTGALLITATVVGSRYTGVLSGALLGALLGFLVFNHHPAKVFMGDTGSLFIGGIIVGCAVSSGQFIAVMLMGMVFIIDMLTSLIQKYYYKLTKKRLFKRAPIHHSFELSGWSENKIVFTFLAASIIFCAIGILGVILPM